MDFDDVAASGLTKKELLGLRREKDKLEKTLGGIRDMGRTPQAVWIVDTKKEHLAVDEARKLRIPVDRHPGHQLRSRRGRLRHPGQRRRDPLGVAAHPGAGRRRRRRPDRPLRRQTGAEAEVEPMPDWERELLGRPQEPAPGPSERRPRPPTRLPDAR